MPHVDAHSRTELPGLADACDALAAGRAVVIPNPPPMTYGLVATEARTINLAKGRALDEPVAISVHHPREWHGVSSCLDVPAAARSAVPVLLDLHLTLVLPLRAGAPLPGWMEPAVRGDRVCVFNGRWQRTAALWTSFPRLFGSSANRTGRPPAATAGSARAAFGPDCVVIDGGERDDRCAHAASTVLSMDRSGVVRLRRSGAQDRTSGSEPAAYPRWLVEHLGLPLPVAEVSVDE